MAYNRFHSVDNIRPGARGGGGGGEREREREIKYRAYDVLAQNRHADDLIS